jgi:glycerophosphoryl diester phosphodiesterase
MGHELAAWSGRRGEGPVVILAHRGGIGPWRENTVEAFRGALDAGADGVELDVRRTSDGKLVVHHDAAIAGCGAVHQLRAAELPAWVPALDEALDVCAGAVVNVEVKNSPVEQGFDPAETVAREVAALLGSPTSGPGATRVIVSSFWPASLCAVRDRDPALATGLLVHPSFDATAAAEQAAELGCVALHPFHTQATSALVRLVHERGMAVVVWTVNEPDDIAVTAAAGVDAVISDRVGGARAVLDR